MSMGSNPVFPSMLYNYNISYIINLININKLHKNLVFKILFTKKNLQLLNFLKNFNLIYKYILIVENNKIFIKIYLYYYKNNKICSNFKILSSPSKFFYISLKALTLLNKKTGSSFFLISNQNGIISHKDSIKNKKGGLVLGFFSI